MEDETTIEFEIPVLEGANPFYVFMCFINVYCQNQIKYVFWDGAFKREQFQVTPKTATINLIFKNKNDAIIFKLKHGKAITL